MLTNSGTINAGGSEFSAITAKSGSRINVNENTTFGETLTNGASGDTTKAKFIVAAGKTADFSTNDFTNNGEVAMSGDALIKVATFTNAGTLDIKAAGGNLGKVETTTFTNNNGVVNVDISGLALDQEYTFISGNISGLTENSTLKISGANYSLVNNGTVKLTSFTDIAADSNQQGLQSIIEQRYRSLGLSHLLLRQRIIQAIKDVETTIKKSANAQPRAMLNAFKIDLAATQLQGAIASFLADAGTYYAASGGVMSDASSGVSYGRGGNLQIFATPFGGALSGDGTSGHLLGVSLGATYFADDYIAQANLAYARGSSSQDLATMSNEIIGNLFQLGGFGRYFLGQAEFDLNANLIFGAFKLDNAWADGAGLGSNASFNNYEINAGAVGGWRFDGLGVDGLSLKPFVGVQLYYEKQGEFTQDLGLASSAYGDFMMDILAGAEARYLFKNGTFAYAKLGYEQKVFNTAKDFAVRTLASTLNYDNESYDSFFSANVGGRVLSSGSWRLDLEAQYKRYNIGLNYFGGQVSVRYAF